MNYKVTKEKNLMYFQAYNRKNPYVLDINTGVFYGASGKPIHNNPQGFASCLTDYRGTNNVIECLSALIIYKGLSVGVLGYWTNCLKVADRLDSIGYKLKLQDTLLDIQEVEPHFKKFVKYFKETDDSLHSFNCQYAKECWAKKYHLDIENPMVGDLWRYCQLHPDFQEKTSLAWYYLTHGLADWYFSSEFNSIYNAFGRIKEFFTLCDKLDIQPQKEDFFRSYINAYRTYKMREKEINEKSLIHHYKKHPALAFENDAFVIVIPSSKEDFEKEAEQQSNCVYSMYLDMVLEGETNIVFIRKKDDIEHSYITCEVTNNGMIKQYLLRNNQKVSSNSPAFEFRYEYQKHLSENWK